MSDGNDPLIGQVIADRYRVLELLGEGGMGRVYAAEHVTMRRKSALKVMSPRLALADDAISRFHREAGNASKINHPNVAQIYDFGETADGLLYLAMEFVEGETLRALIARDGAIPLPRAADLTKQIASALAAAHHLGIVHRDLKPDNIMIARHHDGSDWVKVVDFGIAKTVQGSGGEGGAGSQTVTTAGVSLGTPEYMSPEQLAGERLDSRTDLYSLGLVLFNMLTADMPYPRVTSRETLARRLTSRALRLRDVVRADWPPALQLALDKALDPEPADRYLSVTDFANDVVAATSGVVDPDQTVRIAAAKPVGAAALLPARSVDPSTSRKARTRVLAIAGTLIVAAGLAAGAIVALRSGSPRASEAPIAPPVAVTAHPTVVPADTALRPSQKLAGATEKETNKPTERTAADPSKAGNKEQDKQSDKPANATARAVESGNKSAVISPPAAARVDSAPAAVDTTPIGRKNAIASLNHPWLKENGDAAAPSAMATTDTARVRIIAADIQGHMARALDFVRRGELQKARMEYRDAAPVVGMLRELYAGTPGANNVEALLRTSEIQTVQACRVAIQDSTTRAKMQSNFRCEGLIPLTMRAARGRAGTPQR